MYLVLAIIALVLAVAAAFMHRTSMPAILIDIAVALLAIIHIAAGVGPY
jgi:hypothetical protein